jgi:ribosomal protein S18 acetylase RimI-like enzyme
LNQDTAAPTTQNVKDEEFDLVPASEFTFAELTDIYNQTRVDYIVPMPMNETKFREYVYHYDLSLEASVVATDGDDRLGLAMLGVRPGRTWITRLGVVPNGRKGGVGRRMMQVLVDNSVQLGADKIQLEVIKNNAPAERLFRRFGFDSFRELLVVRRPPKPLDIITTGVYIEILTPSETKKLLETRKGLSSWVTDKESLINAGNISALQANLPDGSRGWLVYQNTVFQLTRLVIQTDAGDPAAVAEALLQHLHWRHPVQDTVWENLPGDDPHWETMKKMGYIVSFLRIEMEKILK